MNWDFEIIKALDEDTLYDCIACNYWDMTKDTLRDVLLECIYALHNGHDLDDVREELISLWEIES